MEFVEGAVMTRRRSVERGRTAGVRVNVAWVSVWIWARRG
jgi:hypothetical protein